MAKNKEAFVARGSFATIFADVLVRISEIPLNETNIIEDIELDVEREVESKRRERGRGVRQKLRFQGLHIALAGEAGSWRSARILVSRYNEINYIYPSAIVEQKSVTGVEFTHEIRRLKPFCVAFVFQRAYCCRV